MATVRIVCTHDAAQIAEDLARRLGAEGDDVRITKGRQSLEALPAAREAKEAVLLIWSYDAPSAHYMLEWAKAIPPERLAEIARATGWPERTNRKAPVIDFSAWRGERGGRAWNMLSERLRVIYRIVDPHPEPLRGPAIGVGLAGAAAAGVALVIGAQAPPDFKDYAFDSEKVTLALIDGDAMGGPMDALEPASIGDDGVLRLSVRTLGPSGAPLPEFRDDPLAPVARYEPADLRDPTFLERLTAFTALRRDEP